MNISWVYLIICIIILLVLLEAIDQGRKQYVVSTIISEWTNKTNGFIKVDDTGKFIGNCYLSLENFENKDSHIHLLTNRSDFHNQQYDMGYVIKKQHSYSPTFMIDKWKTPNNIMDDMIYNFKYVY